MPERDCERTSAPVSATARHAIASARLRTASVASASTSTIGIASSTPMWFGSLVSAVMRYTGSRITLPSGCVTATVA